MLQQPHDAITLGQNKRDNLHVTFAITNEIASVKKEVAQCQVDSLIPLLYVVHDRDAEVAEDAAIEMLRDAITRFNIVASALLEDNAGEKVVKADLVRFIDSCRYACTGNLNWRWVIATFALER
ncbi:hypothetical protein EPUS_07518 [Endocarpon pusillum Z07020]|uniref:Uncharacterized protein n=1 Tax=Endocarpon pusillum (strain Z07020 / HMAS-L-300199) TaxID=1263415 RepID=U1HW23_ENDPU|nr:uncharacterized protein EPUS_07518 [Endocarpon pusillum Z07020]ERF73584.1 hypothetical protein EPUS_07518 [Endocarpon pusillum Z07020]